MRKTKILIFLAVISLALFAGAGIAGAAPAITGISGTLSHGSTVTVTGSGFGTKTTASPLSWDDFELHTSGQNVHNTSPVIGTTWTTQYSYDGDEVEYSNLKAHSGSIGVNVKWDTYSIRAFGWEGQGPYTSLYVTWWGNQHWDSGHTADQLNTDAINWLSRKWFYLFGDSTGTGGSCSTGAQNCPHAMSLIPSKTSGWAFYNNSGVAGSTVYPDTDVNFSNTHDVWQRWEFWLVLNSPYTSSNGEVHMWLDAVKKITKTDYRYRYTDNAWDDFSLGNMWQLGSVTSSDGPYAYIDDLYIDTTQARVEIGNGATWSANTLREIQVPSAWSDTSAIVTLNQGSFTNLNNTYLYVIDANGNVNANGYLLSGGADTTPPTAPTGLAVQ